MQDVPNMSHRSKTLTILLLLSKSFAELDMEIYEGPRLYFVLTVRQDWLQLAGLTCTGYCQL